MHNSTASNESPPTSKKSSDTPKFLVLSTSHQMLHTAFSEASWGRENRSVSPFVCAGDGSASRSSLPLGVAGSDLEDEARALSEGFRTFIRKPYRFEELVDAVSAAARSIRDAQEGLGR